MKNYYKEKINERIDKQIAKGINKYGVLLEEDKDLDVEQKLDHLSEELVDALFYIEHLQEHFKTTKLVNKVNRDSVIESIASLIYLVVKIEDEDLKHQMITELKSINNTMKHTL